MRRPAGVVDENLNRTGCMQMFRNSAPYVIWFQEIERKKMMLLIRAAIELRDDGLQCRGVSSDNRDAGSEPRKLNGARLADSL